MQAGCGSHHHRNFNCATGTVGFLTLPAVPLCALGPWRGVEPLGPLDCGAILIALGNGLNKSPDNAGTRVSWRNGDETICPGGEACLKRIPAIQKLAVGNEQIKSTALIRRNAGAPPSTAEWRAAKAQRLRCFETSKR